MMSNFNNSNENEVTHIVTKEEIKQFLTSDVPLKVTTRFMHNSKLYPFITFDPTNMKKDVLNQEIGGGDVYEFACLIKNLPLKHPLLNVTMGAYLMSYNTHSTHVPVQMTKL